MEYFSFSESLVDLCNHDKFEPRQTNNNRILKYYSVEQNKLVASEKYDENNNLIERTFYKTNNANEVAYREIFTTNETNNKYISKIVDKNYKELGERVYADRVTINNNNNNDQLEYVTIYQNGNTWNIYKPEQESEPEPDYINIVNSCLASKNQNMIVDNIA